MSIQATTKVEYVKNRSNIIAVQSTSDFHMINEGLNTATWNMHVYFYMGHILLEAGYPTAPITLAHI